MEDEGPSLPSDYVTILHLKERWLKQQQQQQQQQSNPNHPQPKDEPKHESASKIPNETLHPRNNRHQINNHPKPNAAPHDSASKTPNEGRNRPPVVNQLKLDVVVPDDSASKTAVQVADNHSLVEKQEQNADQSKSKPSATKNSSRGRNPRFATNQITNDGSTPPLEPEPVRKKKQHLYTGGRSNRSQEVREPKGETTPFAPAVDDSSHNEPEVVKEKKQPRRNRNQEVREPKGEMAPFAQAVDDSSQNEPEIVKEKKQHRRNRNQEVREPKGVTAPFAPPVDESSHNDPEVVQEKKQHRRNRNQEVREQKGETPPFAQIVNDDSLHNETESVREKKQHRGGRNRNRNQEVWEPKCETPPFAQNVNDSSSHNDSGAAAAAVGEIRVTNVRQRSNRRYDSGSFYNGRRNGGYGGVKPPFGARIGQTTAVWVKKGESSLN